MTTVDTGPLGFDLAGPEDAPVLVLGSSLGTNRHMWAPQTAALTGPFRVLRYDHLGHGTSEVPAGPYTMERLADAVLALADGLGIKRFHYAGLSLGGMIGMALAQRAPDRVDRLALLCTTAYLPPAQGWLERAETVRADGMSAIADAVTGRWFTAGFDAVEWSAYRDMLLATDPVGYAGCCAAIAGMDLRAGLPAITAPTLVVSAAQDPSIPPDHGERIAEAVPGARFVVVAGAAHLASVQRPDEVTRLLLEHLGGDDDQPG